jgi:hypothetical protein
MRVSEGTSYEQTDGTWQKPEVELDDSDFERLAAELNIDPSRVSVSMRYAVLSAYARRLMLATQLTSTRRLDSDWIEKTGRPQLEQVTAELQELLTKIRDAN